MDQVPLVMAQIDNGQKLLGRLAEVGFPVLAAGWIKTDEDSKWYLYLVSPLFEKDGIRKGYRRVHTVIRQIPDEPFRIDPFDVKLVDPSESIAKVLVDMQRRHTGWTPFFYGGPSLPGRSIEGAYCYPPIPTSVP
jgi:hypothetical protein